MGGGAVRAGASGEEALQPAGGPRRDNVRRFAEMERSPLLHWLLGFRGFSECLLADDLFLAKLAMEMGVGMIAKVCGIDMDES